MTKTEKVIEKLTPDKAKIVKRLMWHTFETIASDLMAAGETSSIPKAEAIEVTLDASYMETYARTPEEKDALSEFRKLSYDEMKILARTVFTCSRYS